MTIFETAHEHLSTPTGTLPLEAIACGLLVVGTAADLTTTAVGLQYGLVESNPIALPFLEQFGIAGLLGLKLVAAAIVAAGSVVVARIGGAYWLAIPALVGGLWLLVAIWNALLLQGVLA